MEKINAAYIKTIYQKDDYIVAVYKSENVGKNITVTGYNLPEIRNLSINFEGDYVKNKYGTSFNATSFEIEKPLNLKGFRTYMSSLKCGIGDKISEKIFKKYGKEVWNVLDNEPERLLEIKGVTQNKLDKILIKLKNTKVIREIMAVFNGFINLSLKKAEKIASEFGPNASIILKNNPYELIKVKGIGFSTIDQIGKTLHADLANPLRIKGATFCILAMVEAKGSVCIPKPILIRELMNLLNKDLKSNVVDELKINDVLYDMVQNNDIAFEHIDENKILVYDINSYYAECSTAMHIRKIKNGTHEMFETSNVLKYLNEYSSLNSFQLADCQRNAVIKSLLSPMVIITGGPGVGKTTIEKAILYVFERVAKNRNVLLLAPTGRAARRMSEQTGYSAQTIHSALGYSCDDDGEEFMQTSNLEADLIIIDEVSMMDQFIAAKLLKAIPSNCRVIFVGDPDQLPSVSAGNVLRDMIDSERIDVAKLDVVFRQSEESVIVKNSQKINSGDTHLVYSKKFIHCYRDNNEEIFEKASNFYVNCVKAYGIDNVVLLTPWRNKGTLCVNEFNKHLHERLNSKKSDELTVNINNVEFRIGDKVMQTKNTDSAKNGDTGYIIDICLGNDENGEFTTLVKIEFNGDGNIIDYTKDDMNNIVHAYASTIHKSQGSEYKIVILIMALEQRFSLKRNLLYTGVTRATDIVALCGQKSAVDYAISNKQPDKRVTYLKQRLKKALYKTKTAKEETTYEQFGF